MAELRRCIGSAKYGIEAHDAPVDDFPKQPSQRDGLGRMCRSHWNEYTTALRKAALARAAKLNAASAEGPSAVAEPVAAGAKRKSGARRRRKAEPVAEVEQEPPTG